MAINSLTGTASPGVSVDDGFTEKFKVFCRPPQTRNNNNSILKERLRFAGTNIRFRTGTTAPAKEIF